MAWVLVKEDELTNVFYQFPEGIDNLIEVDIPPLEPQEGKTARLYWNYGLEWLYEDLLEPEDVESPEEVLPPLPYSPTPEERLDYLEQDSAMVLYDSMLKDERINELETMNAEMLYMIMTGGM